MCWATILVITATFLVLDGIYFTINNSFFKKTIQNVQKAPIKTNYVGVVLAYVFLVAMEYYFVIMKNLKAKDAFLLGMGIYGVYEFTNLATLSNWPLSLVIMDTLWGGVLFASATCMIRYVLK
jgi:uncharacterized membrane protein